MADRKDPSRSPGHEDSSSSEKDGEQEDRDIGSENADAYMEHDDGNPTENAEAEDKKSKSNVAATDHPLSLVVNASA